MPNATPAAIEAPDLAESPGAPALEPGAEALRQRQWVKARKRLGQALTGLDPAASLDAVLAGHALLGRACLELKDRRCATYYSALDEATAPLRERARAAFEICLKKAESAQRRDEFSARCEAWLAKTPR
jgi:hypothetical protein